MSRERLHTSRAAACIIRCTRVTVEPVAQPEEHSSSPVVTKRLPRLDAQNAQTLQMVKARAYCSTNMRFHVEF